MTSLPIPSRFPLAASVALALFAVLIAVGFYLRETIVVDLALLLVLLVSGVVVLYFWRRHSEALHFSSVWVNSAGDAIVWYRADGTIGFTNPTLLALTGYTADELRGRPRGDLEAAEAGGDRDERERALRSHGSVRYDTVLLCKAGGRIPVEMMETRLSFEGKELTCAIARDLSGRIAAEEEIRHVNRMYAILSKVNEAVARVGETHELYAEICRIAVADGRMSAAAVFQPDPISGLIRATVIHGAGDTYLRSARSSDGPVGEAWASGIQSFEADTGAVAAPALWKKDALEAGFRSIGAFPVRVRGNVVAVVVFYSSLVDFFSAEERKLLNDLAVDVSFGIEFVEGERERKSAADSLRMSEFTYRVLFENNPRPIFVYEPHSLRILAANETALRQYGYTREEFLSLTLRDIRPPEEVEKFERYIAQNGTPPGRQGIWRHKKKNGEVINVEVYHQDFEFKGRPAKIAEVFDITERENLLLKLEGLLHDRDRILERLQFQFEIMPIGCVVLDQQGTIVNWNPAATAIFGYPKEEMVGQRKLDLLLPPEVRAPGGLIAMIAAGKQPGRLETMCLAKSGDRRLCEWTASPMLDTRGERIGVMAMVRDVTIQRRAEQEIRKLNEELEARVMLRTRQLENANRELEAFSYSVSHDLRAPLRGIEGFTKILEEDHSSLLADEAKRFLSLVRSNATKMNQLIEDLLGFSRVGRQALTRVPVDMTALAQDAVHGMPPGQHHLVTVKPLPPVQGDPPLLRQVWVNLISNALKFSARAQQPSVVVESVLLDDETVYLVRDNGAGFDMQYADKLFGVFQRLHASSEFEGTGVGLAIVQRIIQRHGGRVWAHGEPGKGATFYFTVPAGSEE